MAVLTAEGLVGRISEVSAASSKVLPITDPSSSISGLIQRSRVTGIVKGHVDGHIVMRYIPQGEVVFEGDVILTSGLGGNLPKRLLIGQVAEVVSGDVDMFRQARVVPVVNLDDLETVMVLLSFAPMELSPEGSEEWPVAPAHGQ
jgi:rod shape-determining protein MreC